MNFTKKEEMKNIKEYYIMGCGELGQYLKTFFEQNLTAKFLGFLDNKKNGQIIYKPQDIPDKNIFIFVGSINYMFEMYSQLKTLGFNNIITFAELTNIYTELQSYNQAYMALQNDYKQNNNKYEQVMNLLADSKSKEILSNIIEYRKTLDINIYNKIASPYSKQYFEDFMKNIPDIFIDGGGFDGDSILSAIENHIRFNKIYFFEPDINSLIKAKENLKDVEGIEYFQCGISDSEKYLKFNAKGTLGSSFIDDGNIKLKCIALDDVIKEDKAYIKLDIEGAEIDAINGAKRLINNNSPFAICVYHKPSDIWEIPLLIQNINPNYQLYLRHYSNNIFETVLYGVPLND